MNQTSLSRLPRRVLFALVIITVMAAIALMLSGFLPPRSWGTFVLPLYFATLLLVLALAYLVSGNTLMHHYRTGTVQRESNPTTFWCIVFVQLGLAVVLFIFGFMRLGPVT
jgi:uncharacterized membrane protein YhdT